MKRKNSLGIRQGLRGGWQAGRLAVNAVFWNSAYLRYLGMYFCELHFVVETVLVPSEEGMRRIEMHRVDHNRDHDGNDERSGLVRTCRQKTVQLDRKRQDNLLAL